MATITLRPSGKFRAEVRKAGVKESQTFRTRALAQRWAADVEQAIEDKSHGRAIKRTVREMFEKYAEDVSPNKQTAHNEILRGARIIKDISFADELISDVTAEHWRTWRNGRKVVADSNSRDFTLIRHVYSVAVSEWKWLPTNPMHGTLKNQRAAAHREVLWDQADIDRQLAAMGWDGSSVDTVMKRVALGFLIALETGMRENEIFSLTPDRVMLGQRCVRLNKTKNGGQREVPLSSRAVELFKLVLPLGLDPVFGVGTASACTQFIKARRWSGVAGKRFHDARHTAATRLGQAGKITPFELARMFGWKNMSQALVYFNATATSIAAKLD